MICPNCGLTNPDNALWCDCGYDFSNKRKRQTYTKSTAKGKGYNASGNVRFFREHTCINCNTVFRYLIDTNVNASGSSEQEAKNRYKKAMTQIINSKVLSTRCPECGIFQPDMIGSRSKVFHSRFNYISLFLLLILMILAGLHIIPLNLVIIIYTLFNLMILILRIVYEIRNSTSNQPDRKNGYETVYPEIDRSRKKQLRLGLLNTYGVVFWLLILINLTAVAVLYIPEFTRLIYHDPINYNLIDNIAGPGEQTTCRFPTGISSVAGHWKAKSNPLKVSYKKQADCPESVLPVVKPVNKPWRNFITVKRGGKNVSVNAAVNIRIPDIECLAHKEFIITVELIIAYPFMYNSTTFKESTKTITKDIAIKTGSRHAKERYLFLWRLCLFIGTLLLFVTGYLMARLNGKLKGNPLSAIPANS